MGRSAGEERSAVLSASCAEICSSPKTKWRIFAHERGKWVRETGEVPDEYSDYPYRSEECADLGKVGAWTPIDDLVNLNGVQNVTFGGTNMAYNCDFASADKRLLTGEGSSTIFHSLHYSIDILKMLPNEAANSAILWNCLEGSIIVLIGRHGATNRHVVDIWNSIFWNFGLKYVSYVVVKYGNCVRPSHR